MTAPTIVSVETKILHQAIRKARKQESKAHREGNATAAAWWGGRCHTLLEMSEDVILEALEIVDDEPAPRTIDVDKF